jgi:hypothetical protein
MITTTRYVVYFLFRNTVVSLNYKKLLMGNTLLNLTASIATLLAKRMNTVLVCSPNVAALTILFLCKNSFEKGTFASLLSNVHDTKGRAVPVLHCFNLLTLQLSR